MSLYRLVRDWIRASQKQDRVEFAILSDMLEETPLDREQLKKWADEVHERSMSRRERYGFMHNRYWKHSHFRHAISMAVADLNILRMFGTEFWLRNR